MAKISLQALGLSSPQEYQLFIGGRTRYNNMRKAAAQARRMQLLFLLTSGKFHARDKKGLAAELGVDPATIWRDLLVLTSGAAGRCPTCGQLWPHIADDL